MNDLLKLISHYDFENQVKIYLLLNLDYVFEQNLIKNRD